MKILMNFICCCLLSFSLQAQETMSLVEIFQAENASMESFDLSGLKAQPSGEILLISDKPSQIYSLKDKEIIEGLALQSDGSERYDLEGIDACGTEIFVACESGHNTPYLLNKDGSLQKIEITYPEGISPTEEWGNAGLEGIALDCERNIMYLAKERGPKHIYEIQLNDAKTTGKVIREIKLEEDPTKGDISDIKYLKKGKEAFLYVLLRKDRNILRINLESGATETRSYAPYVTTDGQQSLYTVDPEKAKYGMAEALLITDKEIWVGLDNNTKLINESHELAEKYGLKGGMPVILVLERDDF